MALLAIAACDSDSFGPTAGTRAYRSGFSAIPPRRSICVRGGM